MKKSLVALAVLGAASLAQAAPQANTFYAGARAGWASFHDGITQLDAKNYANHSTNGVNGLGINKNSVTYGAFAGYQITDNLAAELAYDFFGRVRGTSHNYNTGNDKETFNHRAHGTSLSLKASYPIIADLDAYAKVGAALVKNTYKSVNRYTHVKTHEGRYQTSLLLGAGLEYAITPELAARVEYQWLNNAGKAGAATLNRLRANGVNATDYRPDISSVTAGISYRFGQGAAPVVEPEVVTKNFAFSSDVLFGFNKANLAKAGKQALDTAYAEISSLGLDNPAVQVNGYADRIGKQAYNLKLSQRRAETVANYIVSKGVNPASVTAVGYGSANPVTGATCDTVKGRKALIACLAPDRRVEVQVQGSKSQQVAM